MSVGASSGYADESATATGLALLDELGIALLECLLVAEALTEEVDLNLDEILGGLQALQQPALAAFGAASLLYQGAELDESWSSNLSRPKAIFARHNVAVHRGAVAVTATVSTAARFAQTLGSEQRLDRSQDIRGPRPQCPAKTKSGDPCSNTAFYLGAGKFAVHCYPHATNDEKALYRKHQERLIAHELQAEQLRDSQTRQCAVEITSEWIQRHQNPRPWLEPNTHSTQDFDEGIGSG